MSDIITCYKMTISRRKNLFKYAYIDIKTEKILTMYSNWNNLLKDLFHSENK